MRAGQDTTRLLIAKGQRTTACVGDTCIVDLKGTGYTYLWDFAITGGDSLATVSVRVDGATACSLQVRDFCGFPGLILSNGIGADSINIGHGSGQHAIGAIKMLGDDDAGLGSAGLEAFHRIPFADSIKVILHGVNTIIFLDLYYHLTAISDWGRYSHWHGTAVSDSGAAAKYLFDSGTIAGGGAYLGTAIHYTSAEICSYMERLIWFKYDNTDSLPGNSTEGHFGGAWFYGGAFYGINSDSHAIRLNDGVYLKNMYAGQMGAYRWYSDSPVCFNTRFGLKSVAGGTAKWRAVSFWYSAN
jgi:hypothetical protein